ncbi:hypothetical protein ACFLY7_02630 [Patescibacteria group bacterium]
MTQKQTFSYWKDYQYNPNILRDIIGLIMSCGENPPLDEGIKKMLDFGIEVYRKNKIKVLRDKLLACVWGFDESDGVVGRGFSGGLENTINASIEFARVTGEPVEFNHNSVKVVVDRSSKSEFIYRDILKFNGGYSKVVVGPRSVDERLLERLMDGERVLIGN